jgi:hypothetical protein
MVLDKGGSVGPVTLLEKFLKNPPNINAFKKGCRLLNEG